MTRISVFLTPAALLLLVAAAALSGDWPGFRGPARDGRLANVRIVTDWKAHPPKLLWKQRIGPGWSSFAVVGERAYTQEQLSLLSGITTALISDAENGKRNLSFASIERLLAAMDVSWSELGSALDQRARVSSRSAK